MDYCTFVLPLKNSICKCGKCISLLSAYTTYVFQGNTIQIGSNCLYKPKLLHACVSGQETKQIISENQIVKIRTGTQTVKLR